MADQTKNTPNFECTTIELDSIRKMVSVFNDFDYDTTQLMNGDDYVTTCTQSSIECQNNLETLVPQEAIENAVLETDRHNGILYDQVTFEHILFDCETEVTNINYLEKVYEIAAGAWKEIPMTQKFWKFLKCEKEITGQIRTQCMMLGSLRKLRN